MELELNVPGSLALGILLEVRVEDLLDRARTLTICFVRSTQHPPLSPDLTHHQVVISDTALIIYLRPGVSWCFGCAM